jgi:hypothetical protein
VVGRIAQHRAQQERDIAASPARSKHLNGNSEGRRLRAGIVRPIIEWSRFPCIVSSYVIRADACCIGHNRGRRLVDFRPSRNPIRIPLPCRRARSSRGPTVSKRAALSGFSFPSDDDEKFRGGRGKRVNRPPPLRLLTISYTNLRFAAIWLVGVLRVMDDYGTAACGAKRPSAADRASNST